MSVDKHRRGQPQLGIGQIVESDPTFPLFFPRCAWSGPHRMRRMSSLTLLFRSCVVGAVSNAPNVESDPTILGTRSHLRSPEDLIIRGTLRRSQDVVSKIVD